MTAAATAIFARSGRTGKMLLDDQVKLNDPGASLYIIRNLAKDGWNGLLRFYEGEVWRLRGARGDSALAGQSYAAAVAFPDAPPEAWRAHGYPLLKDGRRDEGKAALNRYLSLAPNAPDAAMVRYSLSAIGVEMMRIAKALAALDGWPPRC